MWGTPFDLDRLAPGGQYTLNITAERINSLFTVRLCSDLPPTGMTTPCTSSGGVSGTVVASAPLIQRNGFASLVFTKVDLAYGLQRLYVEGDFGSVHLATLPVQVSTTDRPSGCPANGASNSCSSSCHCGSGWGDCDGDSQCQNGLVCAALGGVQFGLTSTTDVCVLPHCNNGLLDAVDGETGIDCGGACGACQGLSLRDKNQLFMSDLATKATEPLVWHTGFDVDTLTAGGQYAVNVQVEHVNGAFTLALCSDHSDFAGNTPCGASGGLQGFRVATLLPTFAGTTGVATGRFTVSLPYGDHSLYVEGDYSSPHGAMHLATQPVLVSTVSYSFLCYNGVFNSSNESDLDCGRNCAACADGSHCLAGSDCRSTTCTGGVCQGVTCTDGIQNQGETGVDCGGPCAACQTCTDGLLNQDETGIDCGGMHCNVCPPDHFRVFVTSEQSNGNLGGTAGADQTCQRLADAAQRGGLWQAWLSDSSTSARDRLYHSTLPYTLIDGTPLAADWADMTNGTLLHGIDMTEQGVSPVWGAVWTGSDVLGDKTLYSCSDWMFSSGSTATTGWSGSGMYNWTDEPGSKLRCDYLNVALYCVEQPCAACTGCGDGNVAAYEQCDDGNGLTEKCAYGQTSCTVCDSMCLSMAGETAYCGDWLRNGTEECDDGNFDGGDGCGPTCLVETCSDNIQNQGEQGVDCGGAYCAACQTCIDGVQNQDETGVDCGGVCPELCLASNLVPYEILQGKRLHLTTAFSPYLVNFNRAGGSMVAGTLVIDPGVVVKLWGYLGIDAGGTLDARGQNGNEIIFTSQRDDAEGGDTDGDGGLSTPTPDSWIIHASDASSVTISHAVLRYGGNSSPYPGESMGTLHKTSNGQFSVTHSVFSNTSWGLWIIQDYTNNDPFDTHANAFVISQNEFSGCGTAVRLDGIVGPVLVTQNHMSGGTFGVMVLDSSANIDGNNIVDNAYGMRLQGQTTVPQGNVVTQSANIGVSYTHDSSGALGANNIYSNYRNFYCMPDAVYHDGGDGYCVPHGTCSSCCYLTFDGDCTR